ncbi:ComF family protein [Allosaccharopolyspora coralli]|uniref:ComF family protein n=1 Tax=Allosaccharopolyspora coralli TaxID=2665642 RepID=A0A5Q3QID4_9PSEU|nr:ComF family protein [Allosaccharopolyspora coralli]QGK71285.1 ComF family protein [Allosaccharopolyspora coralli]
MDDRVWWRDVARGLADLVAPLACAGCGARAQRWCSECAAGLDALRPVRRRVFDGGPPVFALGRYRGAARRGVVALKVSGRRDLARPFGLAVAAALRRIVPDGGWCLVPAPSRTLVARRRGGSHMARVARAAAAELPDSVVAECLAVRGAARDSVGLGAQARMRNLSGRIRLRPARAPTTGRTVVLVDDVVTTGATVACSVDALQSGGHPVHLVLGLTATAG